MFRTPWSSTYVMIVMTVLSACGGGELGNTDGGPGSGRDSGATDGGSSEVSLVVFPSSATMGPSGSLAISARVVGATNQTVVIGLESGLGRVTSIGLNTALYSPSQYGIAVIRATALADARATATVRIAVADVQPLQIWPNGISGNPFAIAPRGRHTFAAVELDGVGRPVGFSGVTWLTWRGSSVVNGTVEAPAAAGTDFLYATEPVSNRVAVLELEVGATDLPSIEIVPALSTVSPGAVIDFTASPSSAAVMWSVDSLNGGTISATGRYTAPQVSGVYVIGGSQNSGRRKALATVVVR